MTKTNSDYKVIKQSKDGQGEWFSHKAAFIGSLEECEAYAARFMDDQLQHLAGQMGHRITIQTRGSREGREKFIKIYRYDV